MAQKRIGVEDRDGRGSCTAWVVWGFNRLMQKRQFAFEGRKWYYQPKSEAWFIPVTATEVPLPVVGAMATESGLTVDYLRYPENPTPV
jgi:hypothetical protein